MGYKKDRAAREEKEAEKKAERDAKKAAREAKRTEKKSLKDGDGADEPGEPSGSASGADDKQSLRPTADELGFFIRTGPDANVRKHANMDIHASSVQLFAGSRELLSSAELRLVHGVKYGLVGRNGVGKSTLLRAIDERIIDVPSFIHIIHVEQEIIGDDTTAVQSVVGADKERAWLLNKEKELLEKDDDDIPEGAVNLNEVYERLDEVDADGAIARAAAILTGLGFDHEMQETPTKAFSGGWRMRIALAQALFMEPDLLLLDEPTNHLDVHALTWLEEFLRTWEKCVIVVSHDRGFLNNATTATMHMHRKRLAYYGGSYDTFMKVRSEHRANQESTAKEQGRRASHLKQFIARFGQGHRKMVRQAQCRMKKLAKLQEEMVEVDTDDPYLRLEFPSAAALPPPCISVIGASFGYTDDKILYEKLDFGVDCDSRVAVVGPNGAGKSTFLKLLDGEIVPVDGWINRHTKLRLARFSQHQVEVLDLDVDSVTHMRRLGGEEMSVETARRYLGKFGLSGDLATQPINHLSGGQKSRLAFAELAWKQPHILLLDEPTNHLDIETIESLAMALNRFDGGVILVSHDERLIELVADELWVVHKGDGVTAGHVEVFNGSFEEYRNRLRDDVRNGKISSKKDTSKSAGAKKEKKEKKKDEVVVVARNSPEAPRAAPVPEAPPAAPAPEAPLTGAADGAWGDEDADDDAPPVKAAPVSKGAYVPPHLRNRG